MLSPEEKSEMLEDAKSRSRRLAFDAGQKIRARSMSLDEYISFLDSVQKMFTPFKISTQPTIANINKL
jgi:hypothetical protein